MVFLWDYGDNKLALFPPDYLEIFIINLILYYVILINIENQFPIHML